MAEMNNAPENLGFAAEGVDPTYLSIAAGLVRGVVNIAAGLGFGWALTVTGDQVTMVATAGVMAGMLGWSTYQKIGAVRKRRYAATQSAVQSAEATFREGTPVAVTVVNPQR